MPRGGRQEGPRGSRGLASTLPVGGRGGGGGQDAGWAPSLTLSAPSSPGHGRQHSSLLLGSFCRRGCKILGASYRGRTEVGRYLHSPRFAQRPSPAFITSLEAAPPAAHPAARLPMGCIPPHQPPTPPFPPPPLPPPLFLPPPPWRLPTIFFFFFLSLSPLPQHLRQRKGPASPPFLPPGPGPLLSLPAKAGILLLALRALMRRLRAPVPACSGIWAAVCRGVDAFTDFVLAQGQGKGKLPLPSLLQLAAPCKPAGESEGGGSPLPLPKGMGEKGLQPLLVMEML